MRASSSNTRPHRRRLRAGALIVLSCTIVATSASLAIAQPTVAEVSTTTLTTVLFDYQEAGRRLALKDMDAATYWFYRAQLRAKIFLAAHPDAPPDQAPALYASLDDVYGRPINEYAFGDVAAWGAIVDRVLAWEAANDDPKSPKARFPKQHAEIRAGLVAFRDKMMRSKETIRATRTANGLQHRD